MRSALLAAIRRLGTEERGITIVEAVVAALLLTIGAMAVLQLFDTGARNTFRTQQSQVVNDLLQRELEKVERLPYAEVALEKAPGSSVSANDPRWRVDGTRFAVDHDGAEPQQMVYVEGTAPDGEEVHEGEVAPGPEPFDVGGVKGHIFRFVTWSGDPECEQCGGGEMKRVIVAATLDDTALTHGRAFQEMQTQLVNPEATIEDAPPPFEKEVEAGTAQFWLTDTPCSAAARQPIVAGHPAHDTHGLCSDGPQSGETPGAPDLMLSEAPVLDTDYPPDEQPLYDYSQDVERQDQERIGLAMPSTNSSCLLQPVLEVAKIRELLEGLLGSLSIEPGPLDGILNLLEGGPGAQYRLHTWLSPEVAGEGGVLLGRGTLDLYTRSVNGAVSPGEICVSLFVRQKINVPVCLPVLGCLLGGLIHVPLEVDLPVINLSPGSNEDGVACNQGLLELTAFSCSMTSWPTQWTKLSVPLRFAAVNATSEQIPLLLTPGSRIGVSVMVKKPPAAEGGGLEFMYDAVGFESRLELETNHLIAFK